MTLTWIVSGLLSMNPWNLFAGRAIDRAELEAYRGTTLKNGLVEVGAAGLPALAQAKEFEWTILDAAPYLLARYDARNTTPFKLDRGSWRPLSDPLQPSVERAARRAMPHAGIARIEVLAGFDAYYYERHTQRPLPALRILFNDDAGTWWHVDATTGELLFRLTRSSRLQRWLYYGLHSFDLPWLNERQMLRQSLLVAMCLGGLALSITGVVIAWRFLRSQPLSLAPVRSSERLS